MQRRPLTLPVGETALTRRELEILRQIATGVTDAETAHALFISRRNGPRPHALDLPQARREDPSGGHPVRLLEHDLA